MPFVVSQSTPVLVLDTCGEHASIALFRGSSLVAETVLQERAASTSLLSAIRDILRAHKVPLRDLGGVGVVNGPGSFTGVRVGLAMAKGLCEAADLPVAAASRLAVLAETAGLRQGFALSPAGKNQVYVRELTSPTKGHEFMADTVTLEDAIAGREVAVSSFELAEQFRNVANVQLVQLSARHAIGAVLACFGVGGSDLASLDANYVRNEAEIYCRSGVRVGQDDARVRQDLVS